MILEKVINLINREIKEENEPKDTAVLIRVLCLIDILFITIHTVFAFFKNGATWGVVSLALTLLLWLTFFLSYKISMSKLVYMYYLSLTFDVIILVLVFGLTYRFHAQLYIIFMIFFYRAAGLQRERVLSVLFSGATLLSLIFYVSVNGDLVGAEVYGSVWQTWFCTVYVISKSATLAMFFRKKFSASEEKIIKYSKRLEMLATTDPLTKLQNRRGMLKHIEDYAYDMINNSNSLLTVGIGDIDFFKHINDTYGHDAGDYVLETLARLMNEFMDGKGMVARWGGEEFLFTFENINGDYAFEEISKLLHIIERYEFSFNGIYIKVTMTFGLEEYDDNLGIDKVISRADEKLYMGKEQGRNRVIY